MEETEKSADKLTLRQEFESLLASGVKLDNDSAKILLNKILSSK